MEPRIAIVSDPLVQRGGAERVVEAMAEAFPEAPIFALLYSSETGPASLAPRVIPSMLNRLPGATKRHRWLFPLYPAAIESFDLSAYDIILSSHHSVAKNVLRGAHQFHVCYCHTPMRALWERSLESRSLPKILAPIAEAVMRNMRVWDYAGAARVDEFITNSVTTQRRIARHYRREATILAPPIDTTTFTPTTAAPDDYYLVASRLIPYKRVDLAVSATAAVGRRLIVVGTGPGIHEVRHPHVDYRGHVSDAELVTLMQRARAMIFPAHEDFGMAPVELMACGRPVIAFGKGGAAETVLDGVTGVFSLQQTTEAFAEAIRRFERLTFDSATIRAHAQTFSRVRFIERLRERVADGYDRSRL